jgi:AraC-like DNA-binding protein
MRRAQELFTFEDVASGSPHVSGAWRTRSEPDPDELFMSTAGTNWEVVVTRPASGLPWVSLRGPETTASPAPIPADAEFLGIRLHMGTYLTQVDMRRLVDRSITLPASSTTDFRWLDGSVWELPTGDNVDVLIERLAAAGLLVHDPVVVAALHGEEVGLSTRSVERRVSQATGLTRGAIRQIRRAEAAVEMLERGVPAREVARRAGYADQPHLTRSLKRFVGHTPSQAGGTP